MRPLITFLVLCLTTGLFAQEVLTAEEAVRLAVERNYGIRLARLDAKGAELLNTPGLAGMLPNLDAVGAWRTMDGKFPVDATGTLPTGKAFTGPAELKASLQTGRDAFVKGLTDKLLTYALGRGLERADRPVVAAIAAKLPASNYRCAALVQRIVESLPCQQRRAATRTSTGAKSE